MRIQPVTLNICFYFVLLDRHLLIYINHFIVELIIFGINVGKGTLFLFIARNSIVIKSFLYE